MAKLPSVLIVDDEEIFLNVAKSMVKMLGLPVMTAYDGNEAIAIFQEHADDIGCIVLDVHMPRMNGIETFRHLKKMRKNVQVIIASGVLDDGIRKQLDPLHPAGYLQKPVTYQQLSDLLVKSLRSVELWDRG
jgi:CheY-like chemotaxis protein